MLAILWKMSLKRDEVLDNDRELSSNVDISLSQKVPSLSRLTE